MNKPKIKGMFISDGNSTSTQAHLDEEDGMPNKIKDLEKQIENMNIQHE